jgi:LCP family protein required for cell wall assembly
MRRSLLSVITGSSLGLFFLVVVFATASIASPGWLNALWSDEAPVVAPPPAQDAPGAPDQVEPPAATAEAPAPTLAPLPTAPDAACGGPEQMTIALLGVDDRTSGYARTTRTDAISLVNVRFVSKSASLLSFPRDLYVPLPNLEHVGITQDRLNTAFLWGEVYSVPGGGPAEFKATIEWNFGVRVDRYVMVNFAAFEAAVDALGGIDVDVPVAIHDPNFPSDSGGGTIVFELPAGRQHMDGKTALRYARTRHQDDDYRRVQRQQLVLLAIRDKLLSPQVIPQIPALLQSLWGLVKTDLSPEEIAALACIGPQIDRSAITTHAINGTMVVPWTTPTGGRVSIPNRRAIAPVVDEFLGR